MDEYETHNADMHVEFWLENFKGRYSCGDLDVNGRIILKCILKKWGMGMCRPTEFNTDIFSSECIYVIFYCKIHTKRRINIFQYFFSKSSPTYEQHFLLNFSY